MEKKVKSLMAGIFVGLSFILSSCNSGGSDTTDELERWHEEVSIIDNNLANAGISAVKDPESGVSMVITKLGTGLPAQKNNTIDVDYIGRRYEDKVVFDEGNTKLKLSDYIEGWKVAFSKLPSGSEAKLIIPSLYGYRTTGSPPKIPGNTILEFDVKFKKVTLSSTEASRLKSDSVAIDAYLATKSITAIKDTTGLRYVITTPGSGPLVTWYDKLTLKYSIKLLADDTKTIVTVEREPSDLFYSRAIDYVQGMIVGLQKLSLGSKAVLYIPSVYAFGADGASDGAGASIPPNANIIVEVEIQNIE